MDQTSKRIRVIFDEDDILNETQKSEGLNRSWVLLKPDQHSTISDVTSYLLHSFRLHSSCPHSLLLSISGFILPPFESTCILKDNEIVRVRKRRDALFIEGNHQAADGVQKLEAAGKQPVNSGVLLLANEEFEKEKGGYESDDPEEESDEGDEENLVGDIGNIPGWKADSKNRKRKAVELEASTSKRKKQRSEAHRDREKGFHTESHGKCDQDAEVTKNKSFPGKEKTTDSNADGEVEKKEENAKLGVKIDETEPEMNRSSEVQENNKETEDANTMTKAARKGPSRSARRKYAKRRFKREMAKIQKKNAVCESESLRNWKEDQAKAEKSKGAGQFKGQKWRKHRTDAETNEVDGQPKGLLHWKQTTQSYPVGKGKRYQQRNRDSFHKYSKQNGDFPKQQKQNADAHEQPDETMVDVQEQPNKKDAIVLEKPNQENGEVQEQKNSKDVEENEIVPIVIRPGHIRFEPLEEEEAQQNHTPVETFKWNGITSKKKGQKWGIETSSFTPHNDYTKSSKVHSDVSTKEKEPQPGGIIDFDKLRPLPSMPKEGDIIAYRVLELSSSWTPELSPFRVGEVSQFDVETNQTLLVPISEYPIGSQKADEDGEVVPSDNSLYKEDGSLEIDFSSLVDVRIFKDGSVGPRNEALQQNGPKTMVPSSCDKPTILPSTGTAEVSPVEETQPLASKNGGTSLWDQITEALNAKKEQLCKESSWGKTPTKVQQPQVNSWVENVNNAQSDNSWGTNAMENNWGKKVEDNGWGKKAEDNSWGKKAVENSWGKNAKKVQPLQQNSRGGKQSSGNKSWSYKALRGSALGPTMAMLRSKTDA